MSASWIRERSKLTAAKCLHLLEQPKTASDNERLAAFHALRTRIRSGDRAPIPYDLPYPKYEFLQYLVENDDLILHGSNHSDITHLEPQRQTTFFGRAANAVFATPDAIWCLFFAIVNNDGFTGSKRNGCLRVALPGNRLRKFYWFSLSEPMLRRNEAFCYRSVYVLPRVTFTQGDIADEWTSEKPVTPLARLEVTPSDFPFIDNVAVHSDSEPPWRFFCNMLWTRPPGLGRSSR